MPSSVFIEQEFQGDILDKVGFRKSIILKPIQFNETPQSFVTSIKPKIKAVSIIINFYLNLKSHTKVVNYSFCYKLVVSIFLV